VSSYVIKRGKERKALGVFSISRPSFPPALPPSLPTFRSRACMSLFSASSSAAT